MARGVSLHIGVKNYSKFKGIDPLKSPWNVARAMYRFAHNLGYRPLDGKVPSDGSDPTNVLIEDKASLGAVSNAVLAIAEELHDGEAFLLTFCGHGTQVRDPMLIEGDSKNEVSVLEDEFLVDDMLHALLAKFEAGVRIFFVADACHSGTSIEPRLLTGRSFAERNTFSLAEPEPGGIMTISADVSRQIWFDRRDKYLRLIKEFRAEGETLKAFAVQFAACADRQVTRDGNENSNSQFTQKFLDRWKAGFSGSCQKFADEVNLQAPFLKHSTPQCTPSPSSRIDPEAFAQFLKKTPFIL